MDLESKRTEVDSAVHTSAEFFPQHDMARKWAPVRDLCDNATTAYLAAANISTEPIAAGSPVTPAVETPRLIETARQSLVTASAAVNDFEEQHRSQLQAAIHEGVGVQRKTAEANQAAHVAERDLASADPRYVQYPSVAAAVAELATARRDLAAETLANRRPAARAAADRVLDSASRLHAALAEAPGTSLRAQQVVTAVRTRWEAVNNRFGTLGPNFSLLLREFPATSSNDLTSNERRAAADIEAAREVLDRAQAAVAQGRPEDALELTATARQHLARADDLVDAVADRLALLRRLRADPAEKERRVRFELRDAQRLAVSAGVVQAWGSVLDAQVARIDRIVDQIKVSRPDLWAYSQALDEVSRFIDTTVNKIRKDLRRDGR
jgi:hypothetical protein